MRYRSRRRRCSKRCGESRKARPDATAPSSSPTSRGPKRRGSPHRKKVGTERLCRSRKLKRLSWTPFQEKAMALHPVRFLVVLFGLLAASRPLAIVGTGTISGHVRDSISGAPIANASVMVVGTAFAAIARQDGSYSIPNVPVGKYKVVARFIGFKTQQKSGIRVMANATVTVDFRLAMSVLQLQEMIVTGVAPRAQRSMVAAMSVQGFAAQGEYAQPVPGVRFDTADAWRYKLPVDREQYDEIVENLPQSNFVFLLDVSGSMMPPNKLPLVKSAMRLLVNQLRAKDRVAMVVYAGSAGLVLPSTPGDQKDRILDAIDRLEAGGSTAGGEGIRRAYDEAVANFIRGGNNRVILATDGDFNVGASSDAEMVQLIEEKRRTGVFLTVLGVGEGNLQAAKMEKLADKGNGNYAYLDNIAEAQKVLVHELGGTLYTVAKDVKIQVEWNPGRVRAYRLIGYENRLLRNEDFADDKKDAGEVGSGHSVTALYEVVPVGIKTDVNIRMPDSLRYQRRTVQSTSAAGPELLFVKVRYKQPDGDQSRLISQPVLASAAASPPPSVDFQFQAAVAEFGLLLRNSDFKGKADLGHVITAAREARGQDPDGYRAEFVRLAETVRGIGLARRDGGGQH